MSWENLAAGVLIGYVFVFIVAVLVYFLPSIIAFRRNHEYKVVILVINLFGAAGIPWLVAMVWAVFPSNKSVLDPVMGNPTGIGVRNVGDTLGAVQYGKERGYADERVTSSVNSATSARPKFCGSCGGPVTGHGRFCVSCGSKIGA